MASKITITPAQLQARLEAGETVREVARSLGVTHQAICWFRDKHNLPRIRTAPTRRTYTQKTAATGRFTDQWGYTMVRTSNRAGALAYTAEHTLVAEQELGRPLGKGEIIHHINGIKSDNRPENLHVCTRIAHMTIHKDLESLAMELVHSGQIVFDGGTYQWAEKPE